MIGVFDSGVGGLSVLQALRARMPHADFVYFGDTENAPYGEKSAKEISELIAMALQRLHAAGASDIVSACNSASVSVLSVPIDLLRLGIFNVVEMVEPTVQALAGSGKRIALLGTPATVRSGIYQTAFAAQGIPIEAIPVTGLAGLIERGASDEELEPVIAETVARAKQSGAEIISLSCTHYPFARGVFESCIAEMGGFAELFDPAKAVAAETASRFKDEGQGTMRLILSKESGVFNGLISRLFPAGGYTIEVEGSIYGSLKSV